MNPRELLRHLFHRASCLNMILVCMMVLTWSSLQVMPTAFAHGEPVLLFGVPTGGRTNDMVGHVAFRMNGNPERFHVWTSNEDLGALHELLSGRPIRILARHSGPRNFTVIAMDDGKFGLGGEQMGNRSFYMGIVGVVISIIISAALIWLLYEYIVFYRRMRWFANTPQDVAD